MPAGLTSVDNDHSHHFNIDQFGNGGTSRQARSDGRGSHVHIVRNGIVSEEFSIQIDEVDQQPRFEGMHNHTLEGLELDTDGQLVRTDANNTGREPGEANPA